MINNQSPTGDTKPISFQKGYKYRIYPTTDQIELLNHTFGCCRFVWNTMILEDFNHLS